MSEDIIHGYLNEADAESETLKECKSDTHLKPATHKTESIVGPSGDYQISVSYRRRSLVANSSRKNSGDSMDDELYGINDDFIEKLNVVRRKLNLIEISDSPPAEETAVCNNKGAVSTAAEEPSIPDATSNNENDFYNRCQVSYSNQNVDNMENSCTSLDGYYEITQTEIKKKGLRSWCVSLEKFDTIFEVSSNAERQQSFSDYLQLTYNPPKKKICKRVHTPVLSPHSNKEHIDLPYCLRVGMDTEVLKTNSRHYLESKCTQYYGSDVVDCDDTHSLIDIDKGIEGTQIELAIKSADTVSEKTNIPTEVAKYTQETESCGAVTTYVHLNPEIDVKIYGSESPENSSNVDSSEDDEERVLSLENSMKKSDLIFKTSKYNLDLRSAYSSSSTRELLICHCHFGESKKSFNLDTELSVLDRNFRTTPSYELPNVPFELGTSRSSPVFSTVTTLKRSKSLLAGRIGSKIFTPRRRPRVSDSCITIKNLPKCISRNWSPKPFPSRQISLFNAESRNTSKSTSKSSSDISSKLSSSTSECTPVHDIVLSPHLTCSLDVPRIDNRKYKYPSIAYLACCSIQANAEELEKLIQKHEEDKAQKDIQWWHKRGSLLKICDSRDSYKETAKQMMKTENNSVQDVLVEDGPVTSRKSLLTCDLYNRRKSQSRDIEFYDQISDHSEKESEKVSHETNGPLSEPEEKRGRKSFANEEQGTASFIDNEEFSVDSGLRSDSDSDDNGSCFTCTCFKNMFTSRETQFFT